MYIRRAAWLVVALLVSPTVDEAAGQVPSQSAWPPTARRATTTA